MSLWRAPLRQPGALIALALLTAVTACAGSDSSPPRDDAAQTQAATTTRDSFDPCSLVTTEEVAAAVGWQPTRVKPVTGGGGVGFCDYETADSLASTGTVQKVEVGIGKCPYNIPCYEDLPKFKSSQELAEYRRKGYTGSYEGVAKVEPLEGWGMPAIHQDMLGVHSVELYVGHNRLAYVFTYTNFDVAKGLAEKMLQRIH